VGINRCLGRRVMIRATGSIRKAIEKDGPVLFDSE